MAATPNNEKNPLKAFQRKLKGKVVIGFGPEKIVLNDGSWWKLTDPVPDASRIDVCGRRIIAVQIVRKRLELTLHRPTAQNDLKVYLDWIGRDGELIQPQLPISNQPKAFIPGPEDPILKEIDDSLDTIERILRGESWDDEQLSEQ